MGDATYVADKLRAKAGSNVSKLDNLISMLRSRHLPALWCSVYYCMQPLLQHWLQLCSPASTREAAELLDAALKGAAAVAIPALTGAGDAAGPDDLRMATLAVGTSDWPGTGGTCPSSSGSLADHRPRILSS